jgi:tight adherence protein C
MFDFLFDHFLRDEGDVSVVFASSVFLAAAMMAYGLLALVRARTSLKRRAAGITAALDEPTAGNGLARTGLAAVQRLIEQTAKHYASMDGDAMKVLRTRLIQAGIFDPRAVGFFFIIRVVAAIAFAVVVLIVLPLVSDRLAAYSYAFVACAGLAGYVVPSMALDKKITARRVEYRAGFPDFMDLLVVCAGAGVALEAALERVSRELAECYPALAANIHLANLEIRAGHTLTVALEHFGERLGLDEVRSFATLIQQSDELGSSITEALRVYSEEMRDKRLSAAEEKAYSLPAKLSVPLMCCVFPVLFIVILTPVIVRYAIGVG